VTGKTVGWEPVEQSSFAKVFRDAFENDPRWDGVAGGFPYGTYELAGPKVNGNPERLERNTLILHAHAEVQFDDPAMRSYDTIRALVLRLVEANGWEGLVYHHPDGRMAKIKARDFRSQP